MRGILAGLAFVALLGFSADKEKGIPIKPLKKVAEVRALSYEDAAKAMPVQLYGTVTAHLAEGFDFQDSSGGIFVKKSGELPKIGSAVNVQGRVVQGNYSPLVDSTLVEVKGTGQMPRPMELAPEFLLTGAADNHWVKTEGTVVHVDPGTGKNRSLILAAGSIELQVRIGNQNADFSGAALEEMIGNRVQFQGTCGPIFNDKKQRIGSFVTCPDLKFSKILTNPQISVKELSFTPIPEIRSWNRRENSSGFVKTNGYVTTAEDAQTLVIQDGKRGMRVKLVEGDENQWKPGDAVTVVGLPLSEGFHVELHYVKIDAISSDTKLKRLPMPIEDPDFYSTELAFSVVSHPAHLIEFQGAADTRPVALLDMGNEIVRGVFAPDAKIPEHLEPGSFFNVTGVKMIEADAQGEIRSAWLSLRGPDDLALIREPSWWTPTRYLITISVLTIFVAAAVMWLTALRRQVRKQTTVIEQQVQKNATLEERNRIARELHDTLSQGFAGVGFQLTSVENDVSKNPERAKEKLELAKRMVEHSMAEARQSLTNLRTPLLDGQSLSQAISTEAKRICDAAGIALKTEIKTNGAGSLLPEKTQHEILKITLEAVANAAKHSRAELLSISMIAEDGFLKTRVMDDGIGFDPEEFRDNDEHFGLRGMRERSRQIKADLRVESSKGAPTVVTLHVTLPEDFSTEEETENVEGIDDDE